MPTAAALSQPTNTKLGNHIHSWSIPAGRDYSCPGESSLCRARCYAKRGFFRMQNVKDSHLRNFEFSQQTCFADWMRAELRANDVRVMRIHVSGDFYSIDYIHKWIEIVKYSQRTQFFAYTRSWRQPELFPELVKLASFSNMQLWWSIDRETGPAPLIRGVRRAYMAINDVDAANAPDDCDLVFRDNPGTVLKKANGVQVCPAENGVTLTPKMTCTKCGICWKSRATTWETVLGSTSGTEINAPMTGSLVMVN